MHKLSILSDGHDQRSHNIFCYLVISFSLFPKILPIIVALERPFWFPKYACVGCGFWTKHGQWNLDMKDMKGGEILRCRMDGVDFVVVEGCERMDKYCCVQ